MYRSHSLGKCHVFFEGGIWKKKFASWLFSMKFIFGKKCHSWKSNNPGISPSLWWQKLPIVLFISFPSVDFFLPRKFLHPSRFCCHILSAFSKSFSNVFFFFFFRVMRKKELRFGITDTTCIKWVCRSVSRWSCLCYKLLCGRRVCAMTDHWNLEFD